MNHKGKKPSERIKEIRESYDDKTNLCGAIIQYLDEQHSLNAEKEECTEPTCFCGKSLKEHKNYLLTSSCQPSEKEETHTVKEEECICSVDGIAVNCPVHYKNSQPTTPEKKCCEKCQRMGRRNETPTVYDVPLPCTSSCPCHQEESEKRNDVY